MKNILFHVLKGSPGWSNMALTKIDIGRIITVDYNKRLFKIFDRDKPYSLEINYYYPTQHLSASHVVGGKGGFVFCETTDLNHLITKRYKSLKDVNKELNEINKKIEKLKIYNYKIFKEINEI